MFCELCEAQRPRQIKTKYDRDSGRHVVGYKCLSCGEEYGAKERVRDGLTFRLTHE